MSDAARPGGVFDQLGNTVVRWPLAVIALWIAFTAVPALLFPPLMEAAAKNQAAALPDDAPTMVTARQMIKAFSADGSKSESKKEDKSSQLFVVLTDEKGLSDADTETYRKLVERLHRENINAQDFIATPPLRELLASKDKKAWVLPVIFNLDAGEPAAGAEYKRVSAIIKDVTAGSTLDVSYAGPVASLADLADIGQDDAQLIEIGTAMSVLLILLMIYRNIVAMLLPLATIGLSVGTAQGVLSGLALIGLDVQTQTIVFMGAVMIGAGTDYAVFLISRYHDYIRQGLDSDQAVRSALMSIGKVIAASAATVAVTFIAMFFAKLSVFSSIGPAISISIVVAFMAAVTLLPAILVLVGRRGWVKPRKDLTHRFWRRTGTRIVRRPVIHLVASLIVLVMLASCTSLARFNYDDLKALPADSSSVIGSAAMDRHFSPNLMSPMVLFVTSPRDLRQPTALADLEQMAQRVAQVPHIIAIRGLTRPNGEPLQQTRVSYQAGEVGGKLDQVSSAINDHGGDLDHLKDGSNQLAIALAGVRDEVTQAVGSAGSLISMLTTAKALIGGDKTLNALDQTAKLVGRMRALGEALDSNMTDVSNVVVWATPLMTALNASPVCNADPACIASRGQLQALVQADNAGTLTSITRLARSLKQTQEIQTVAQTVAQLEQNLNMAVSTLRAVDGLPGKLNQMMQGADALAQGSRAVADGVAVLVDQTRQMGAGLNEASSFLLGMKRDADRPSMGGFNIPTQVLAGEEFRKGSQAFISADGHAARYLVQSGLNGFTVPAMDQVEEILKAARSVQPNSELTDAHIYLAGIPSGLRDTRDYYNGDILFIIFATIIIVFLILVILLRAVVAPLYLIASVIISFLSAIGIGVLLFQLILGMDLHWSLPGLSFILLVAVGADYNMLLISRIRDESPHGVRVGVIRTVGSTGGVITSAGLIFAASMFGLLAASISTMVEAGFIIGTGILIDTFLVRTITVPALAALIGQKNWWPSKLGAESGERSWSQPILERLPARLVRLITGSAPALQIPAALPQGKSVGPSRKPSVDSNNTDSLHDLDCQPLPLFGTVILPYQLTLRAASDVPKLTNGKSKRPVTGFDDEILSIFVSTSKPLMLTGLRKPTSHSPAKRPSKKSRNTSGSAKGRSNLDDSIDHALPLFGPFSPQPAWTGQPS